jgi:hypothetical protein
LATAPAPTVPTPGLLSYYTRTLCSCHATRYWSPPTKAAHSSSQPRASPDSCHPDTFSMKINKDPKDARFGTKGSSAFLLPRGKNRKGGTQRFNFQDGRWARARAMGARPAFQASSVQYSKLFAQRIGASKRDLPAQDPLGLRLRLRLRRSPIASFSTEHLYPLAVSFSIDYCALLQLLSAAKSE